ncbi:hypothetical protein, conserved [Leishmania tarentolae]|uniref:Uncharacterized protein n=1 Tax=Leishmania tarentolae TaxID=5689 RepID=A0A640KJ15_LEITA|nr:hypothetical protein, conserved [Leishmania tarentolae]
MCAPTQDRTRHGLRPAGPSCAGLQVKKTVHATTRSTTRADWYRPLSRAWDSVVEVFVWECASTRQGTPQKVGWYEVQASAYFRCLLFPFAAAAGRGCRRVECSRGIGPLSSITGACCLSSPPLSLLPLISFSCPSSATAWQKRRTALLIFTLIRSQTDDGTRTDLIQKQVCMHIAFLSAPKLIPVESSVSHTPPVPTCSFTHCLREGGGMRWWSQGSEGDKANPTPADPQTTQDVLASIFTPANRALAFPSTSVDGGDTRSAESPSKVVFTASARACSSGAPPEGTASAIVGSRHDGVDVREDPSTWWTSLRKWRSSTPTPWNVDASAPELAPSSTTTRTSTLRTAMKADEAGVDVTSVTTAVSWQTLPDCPLAGYELTRQGLVDRLTKPPHTLTATELRSLIKELIIVEQKAKYDVDRQFSSHIGSRGLHGLELLINPGLWLTSIYLLTWKTAKLYHSALPQNSVFFTRLLALMRLRIPVEQRELVAQRHRRLMRATNARVSLSFLSGAALFVLAWVSRPPANVMEEAADVQTAKEAIAYQRHFESSLKWCWYVYYHHPAYSSAKGGGDTRSSR